jgi:1-phosphofructokinase family hexose kinase
VIVCVSLNPALDRCIWLSTLKLGHVNRASAAESTPGGKAANVALAARALGASVRYIAPLGGPTGQAVEQGLRAHGVEVEAVAVAAPTRVNLELLDEERVTEVLEPGSPPSPDELAALLARCRRVFESSAASNLVAFSGSLPAGVDASFYADLVQLAKQSGLRTILDTSGAWLERGLSAKPDFVKPNQEEAEALLTQPITNPVQARDAARKLVRRGAGAAIVSLGAAGLVGTDGERACLVVPPQIEARSAVASGDAAVAGLALALERGESREAQLTLAAACGAANCLAESPSRLDPTLVEELRGRCAVSYLD